MEESLCRDNHGDQSPCRELEIHSRGAYLPVHTWSGCSRRPLSSSARANTSRPRLLSSSGAWSGESLSQRDLVYLHLFILCLVNFYISVNCYFGYSFFPRFGLCDKFLQWTFHPFVLKSKKIFTVHIWCRVLAFLVACQFLRILTFYSTQLPGPNYHCREGSQFATLPPPTSVFEVFLINLPKDALFGCGDLIFSSHMIFSLVFIRTYQKYGTQSFIKQLAWLLAVIQSLLIVASRKHYSVDVVVAWYTVNLVIFFLDAKLPELPDRTNGVASALLPLSTKDRDSKTKDENLKLLNGNSGDPAEWRQRAQINGKIQDDENAVLVNTTKNGA